MVTKEIGKAIKVSKFSKFVKKNKIFIVFSIILFVAFFIVAGLKVFLVIKLLLGYDTVVKLNVDNEHLNLLHGEEKLVKYSASVTTNPFCNAECEYIFTDLSFDKIIEHNNFTIRPSIPYYMEYLIQSPSKGSGIQLYRMDIRCVSPKKTFCHTKEQESTRTLLLTVDYDLSDEEKDMKRIFEENYVELNIEMTNIFDNLRQIRNSNDILKDKFVINNSFIGLENDFNYLISNLGNLKNKYEESRIIDASIELNLTIKQIDDLSSRVKIIKSLNDEKISLQNKINSELERLKIIIISLKGLKIFNDPNKYEIESSILELRNNANNLNFKSAVRVKELLLEDSINSIELLNNQIRDDLKNDFLEKYLDTLIEYDIYCNITNNCKNISIEGVSSIEIDAEHVCQKIDDFNSQISSNSYVFEDEEMLEDETNQVVNTIMKKRFFLKEEYIKRLKGENIITNVNSIKMLNILENKSFYLDENLSTISDIDKLKKVYLDTRLEPCNLSIIIIEMGNITVSEQIIIENSTVNYDVIELVEPKKMCCVFGNCEECCIGTKCSKEDYPIILLHGHALDKDSIVDFSLEGYGQMQELLEDKGYLNSGTISLFTLNNTPQGILGQFNVPNTFRASYYIDVFKTPENYIAIQAKSENIDTYSIRFKDIVDIVKLKTGKDKVNIVSFSMGGLVARRYMQIFGTEDVNKFVMIGTPNNGIEGDILNYCGIVGENLECRDMDTNSLFINKLNSGKAPDIPVLNIVGTGCNMKGEQGDGAVLERNAKIDFAQNILIEGKCPSRVKPLHLLLRDVNLYPGVFSAIEKFFTEN